MSYSVIATPKFRSELKRLIKKYKWLKDEYAAMLSQLEENPIFGTPLGNGCYKIRLAIASKGKGKSGGARVITYIIIEKATVFLVSIYDKSEKENISDYDLDELLKGIK
jgi:mRNA-degrading endonuclease RelE of RelBE toxin-antitoxin system